MLSIIVKDVGEGVQCSIVGEANIHESLAAVECAVKVIKACLNAPEPIIAGIIGKTVAKTLSSEEPLNYEQL